MICNQMNFICCSEIQDKITYLWNFDEYDKNDASPRPELSDVKTTPEIAIEELSA